MNSSRDSESRRRKRCLAWSTLGFVIVVALSVTPSVGMANRNNWMEPLIVCDSTVGVGAPLRGYKDWNGTGMMAQI